MATTTPPPLHQLLATTTTTLPPPLHQLLATATTPPFRNRHRHRRRLAMSCTYKVIIEHQGEVTELEVDDDETILSKALDHGMSVPHDCKLGVCMTCPAKLVDGVVDQTEGMLSDDVVERGFALLCASYPRSDCRIKTIPEEELLAMQLATAND